MSKPTSSVSTAISIRIDNDLLQAVIDHAQSQGLINESGRMDKRGKPNLSAAVSDLLKLGLQRAHPVLNNQPQLYDSGRSFSERDWAVKITEMETAMIERVCEAISQQIHRLIPRERSREISHPISDFLEPPLTEVDRTKTTKERILEAAARGFRTKGYSGIGIDALAKEAGVTSGAFYGHFRSKEDAFLAAVVAGLAEFRVGVDKLRRDRGENWTEALVDYYFGQKHRGNLEKGCALPIFSPEVIRAEGRVRFAYQTELVQLNESIAAGLTIGNETENRDCAWVLMSLLVGGVTLSRAVLDEDLADRMASSAQRGALSLIAKDNQSEIE
jgi:TetR/AcrR family transcriptional regulator, transcriptional repressor for nem operon